MIGDEIHGGSWRSTLLLRLYESLTLSDRVTRADLIFVLAGKIERKSYGLELYRAGIAPRLLLSIGRFEVSKMPTVDFAGAAELVALRDRTPPNERHFFAEINVDGTHIERAKLGRWNTYGEMLGLRTFLERDWPRSVMFISTDAHLRRVAVAYDRVFHDAPLDAHYCPVPDRMSSLGKEGWWARSGDRKFVLKEMTKLAAYRIIMRMPEWLIRLVMQVKA